MVYFMHITEFDTDVYIVGKLKNSAFRMQLKH